MKPTVTVKMRKPPGAGKLEFELGAMLPMFRSSIQIPIYSKEQFLQRLKDGVRCLSEQLWMSLYGDILDELARIHTELMLASLDSPRMDANSRLREAQDRIRTLRAEFSSPKTEFLPMPDPEVAALFKT